MTLADDIAKKFPADGVRHYADAAPEHAQTFKEAGIVYFQIYNYAGEGSSKHVVFRDEHGRIVSQEVCNDDSG